jgi:RNA polymerase sigma factor (TIGR02999 family)
VSVIWDLSITVSDITLILNAVQEGDPKAAEELLPLVYEELRRLAAAKMAEQPGQTLQPTALVHEAWLKLVGGDRQYWESRRHFFSAAAKAMRHILIDRTRKRQCDRHGGGQQRVDIDEIDVAAPVEEEQLLALNEAIDELEELDPAKAEVVKLKFFVGLSEREAAEVLGVSERTIERRWTYAQAWLFERMECGGL